MEHDNKRTWFNVAAIAGLIGLCSGAMSVGIVYGKLSAKNDEQDIRITANASNISASLSRIDIAASAIQGSLQRIELQEYRIGKLENIAERQQNTQEALKDAIDAIKAQRTP